MSEEQNNEEYTLIWDAPVIEAPEFRLYYKKDGTVDFYTCDKPKGDYIVVDALAFAESRPDVKVVNGRITRVRPHAIVQKLKPSDKGQLTSIEDISIITYPTSSRVQHWELCDHEID